GVMSFPLIAVFWFVCLYFDELRPTGGSGDLNPSPGRVRDQQTSTWKGLQTRTEFGLGVCLPGRFWVPCSQGLPVGQVEHTNLQDQDEEDAQAEGKTA
ncbi:MAG: hypothetical protein M3036_12795, partial [Bifidobacteriales bacterium]|nr:hypothetical protein [Bifidobacteriales bacterium]